MSETEFLEALVSNAGMWAQAQAVAADAARARAELARAHRKRANARSPLRARSARRKQPGAPDLPSVAEAREDRMAATAAASAAVAAGTGADAAVAATRADLDAMRVTQPFKMNNTALKWIRDSHEQPPGFPTAWMVDLTDTDPLDIGVLDRNTGMAYSFKDGETQPWSWRQMLAAFKPDVKDRVLGTDPTVGVKWITCQALADDSYDHKRWHAALHVGKPFDRDAPVPAWDFHVYRTDNVVTRFHTSLTNNKVEVATVGSGLVLPGPPRAGKGKSDGRGTYRRHTAGNYDATVRGTAPPPPTTTTAGNDAAAAETPAVAEPSTAQGSTTGPRPFVQARHLGPAHWALLGPAREPEPPYDYHPSWGDGVGAAAREAWAAADCAKPAWWGATREARAQQDAAAAAGGASSGAGWSSGADWWSSRDWKDSGHGNGQGGADWWSSRDWWSGGGREQDAGEDYDASTGKGKGKWGAYQ